MSSRAGSGVTQAPEQAFVDVLPHAIHFGEARLPEPVKMIPQAEWRKVDVPAGIAGRVPALQAGLSLAGGEQQVHVEQATARPQYGEQVAVDPAHQVGAVQVMDGQGRDREQMSAPSQTDRTDP